MAQLSLLQVRVTTEKKLPCEQNQQRLLQEQHKAA
jgi:hypothetical protein